ncbi:L-histidine N(alpha)-methyltransferase [Paludibaculum fermentans]|uniref:L-histidine N(alpha)-methyltransferase n=1 Tax=Paludibaculum fermentans TaxID=1473598 RepID=UPI003EB6A0B6
MNIASYSNSFGAENHSFLGARAALIHEVQRGLLKRPRSLVPWMLYDAEGSRLFERITALPEYYPTRTEREIFAESANEIVAAVCSRNPAPVRLLELGAGTAAKTGILLDALSRLRKRVVYIPVDVSPDALDAACDSIACLLPHVQLQPLVANYVTHPPRLGSFNGTTFAIYIGSSIGNFSPEEARTILRNLRSQLRAGDALLLGTDLVKDEATLLRAYDDRQGVTAAFNLNLLHRLNRELFANFDTTCFRHLARWNCAESRIEMHLESTRDQHVFIAGAQLGIHFEASETIHTENSYKFTHARIYTLLEDSGFCFQEVWTDRREWYAVTLARAT